MQVGETGPREEGPPKKAALTANPACLHLPEGFGQAVFQLGVDRSACITFTFVPQALLCTHLELLAADAAG